MSIVIQSPLPVSYLPAGYVGFIETWVTAPDPHPMFCLNLFAVNTEGRLCYMRSFLAESVDAVTEETWDFLACEWGQQSWS